MKKLTRTENELSIEDYVRALERMKRGPRDRIGILGELGVTGLGTLAGAAISGAIAGLAGATTLAGSTTLASWLAPILVVATPASWIAGCAVVGGTAAYAITKLVRSGAISDSLRKRNIRELEQRIAEMRKEADESDDHELKMSRVITSIQYLISNQHLSKDKATGLLAAIEKKHLQVDEAFSLLENLVNEKGAPREETRQ